jgi:peroxiredoxin
MRVVGLLLCFTILTKNSFAQNDVFKCAEENYLHMDSVLNQGKDPWAEWHNCVIGKKLPDFSVTTISGQKIETGKLKDKIVVLNLWMIDCRPCILELPALNKLVEEYRDKNVLFLAITFETLKRLTTDFFPKYKFDFDIAADAAGITDMFRSGYPTTFIVDKMGEIKEAWPGGIRNEINKNDMYLNIKPILDVLLKAK